MTDKERDWECGLRLGVRPATGSAACDWECGLGTVGHGPEGENAAPVVVGENGFH